MPATMEDMMIFLTLAPAAVIAVVAIMWVGSGGPKDAIDRLIRWW
jgi:hypothetical protein